MPVDSDVVTLPSGPLCGQKIALPCKGPTEVRTYVIVCSSIIDINDSIQAAEAECNDPLAVIRKITFGRDSVNLTIAGGTRNYLSVVQLTLTLNSGDIRVPILALTTEDQGVLQEGDVNVVVGAAGRRGSMIFTDTGTVPPPVDWTPPTGYVLYPDDILFNTLFHQMFNGIYNADGTITWTRIADFGLSQDDVYTDLDGFLKKIKNKGALPADVTLNGGVYMAGETALPPGLTSNGGVVLTDGTVYFPNTWNNNGVLCAAGE